MTSINKLEGSRLVGELPFKIVAMVIFKNRVIIATEHRVFELIDGVFNPMVFAVPQEEFDSTAK